MLRARVWGTVVKATTGTSTPPKENGDLRTAIVDVLLNDDAVMQTIINAVSDALVSKLPASKDFMATLADKLQAVCPRQQQQGALRRDGRLGAVQQTELLAVSWRTGDRRRRHYRECNFALQGKAGRGR